MFFSKVSTVTPVKPALDVSPSDNATESSQPNSLLHSSSAQTSTEDPGKCGRIEISAGVWECMKKESCRFSYSYGGDVFCKHPGTIANTEKNRET